MFLGLGLILGLVFQLSIARLLVPSFLIGLSLSIFFKGEAVLARYRIGGMEKNCKVIKGRPAYLMACIFLLIAVIAYLS